MRPKRPIVRKWLTEEEKRDQESREPVYHNPTFRRDIDAVNPELGYILPDSKGTGKRYQYVSKIYEE